MPIVSIICATASVLGAAYSFRALRESRRTMEVEVAKVKKKVEQIEGLSIEASAIVAKLNQDVAKQLAKIAETVDKAARQAIIAEGHAKNAKLIAQSIAVPPPEPEVQYIETEEVVDEAAELEKRRELVKAQQTEQMQAMTDRMNAAMKKPYWLKQWERPKV